MKKEANDYLSPATQIIKERDETVSAEGCFGET